MPEPEPASPVDRDRVVPEFRDPVSESLRLPAIRGSANSRSNCRSNFPDTTTMFRKGESHDDRKVLRCADPCSDLAVDWNCLCGFLANCASGSSTWDQNCRQSVCDDL